MLYITLWARRGAAPEREASLHQLHVGDVGLKLF
jgi:hypothetical protein